MGSDGQNTEILQNMVNTFYGYYNDTKNKLTCLSSLYWLFLPNNILVKFRVDSTYWLSQH